MNVNKVIKELGKKYPGKYIIKNDESSPTEIICEIEPTNKHDEWSLSVAVIDKSIPHYHRVTTEKYKVLKGQLRLVKNGKEYLLKEGDVITIEPNTKHYAIGDETWITTLSKPGWKSQDHIIDQR